MPRSTNPIAEDSQPQPKSRFSLLSLLPSRHPPLHIGPPQTLLPSQLQDRVPRQDVPSHHLTTVTSSSGPRIVSQYASPLTCYPETPASPDSKMKGRNQGMSPDRGRRPPPIDLGRIRAAYPTEKAINDIPITPPPPRSRIPPPASSPPILPPFPLALRKEKEAQKKAAAAAAAAARRPHPSFTHSSDDPFDIVSVEPGHRYDSRQGGKVDIRPGEVIPRGLVGSYTARRETRTIRGERPEEEEQGEQYDSVLQHVLLTPTYLRASPSSTHHTITGKKGRSRETMMERARRMSRGLPALLKRDDPAGKAVKSMREREEQEMDRFRRTQGMVLGSTSSVAINREGGSPVPKERRSPGWLGEREARGGYQRETYEKREYRDIKGHAGYPAEEGRRGRSGCWGRKRSKEEMDKMPFWRKMYLKYRILIAILVIVGAAISLAAVLLTRRASGTSTSTSSSGLNSTSTPAPSPSSSITGTGTAPAPAPSSTSRTLQTCLDTFLSPNSGYSCSDCTPLLLGTTNDFTTPLVNGNSTGVGAALQYCTLLDVVSAGNKSAFEGLGWTGKGSCTWSGVKCDARGRVTELSLIYPNVPYRFPTTLGQIPTLAVVRIKGNSSVPAGPFPSSIISPSLVTLDISDTALQGPIASFDFTRAQSLTTLYLANNPILGSSLPDLKTNGRLLTLAATGQLLSNVTEGNLPSSLTYLDLSFNSLSGQVPSFSTLSGLKTLYLESNQFSSAPTSFPTGITDLKLNNNPSLRGGMPSAVCGNTGMGNCDLRNTGLGGSTNGTGAANGTRSCGKCLF